LRTATRSRAPWSDARCSRATARISSRCSARPTTTSSCSSSRGPRRSSRGRTPVGPCEALVELRVPDAAVLRDVLAELDDAQTGDRYDIWELALGTEGEIVRRRRAADPRFEVEQYPSREVTLQSNFHGIAEAHPRLYRSR
jgi:hypothetical protein